MNTWFAATVAVNLMLLFPSVKPSALTEPRFKFKSSNSWSKVLRVKVLDGVESLGDADCCRTSSESSVSTDSVKVKFF